MSFTLLHEAILQDLSVGCLSQLSIRYVSAFTMRKVLSVYLEIIFLLFNINGKIVEKVNCSSEEARLNLLDNFKRNSVNYQHDKFQANLLYPCNLIMKYQSGAYSLVISRYRGGY